MAKAFRCDKCQAYFDGQADTQAGHNEKLEFLLRYSVGIKFSPESKEAQFYIKDLCPDCARLYCELWGVDPKEWKEFLLFKAAQGVARL